MARYFERAQLNIAKIIGTNVKNVYMLSNEEAGRDNNGAQNNNIADIPVVEFEMDIEFDETTLLSRDSNISHVELYLNTTVNNNALNNFVDAISRQRDDFKSHSAYINYLNNLRSAYDSIDRVLEVERYNLFDWQHLCIIDLWQHISFDRMNDFRIDVIQESLALANNNSPLPQSEKKYKPPIRLMLRRSPITAGSKSNKSKGVQIRTRRNTGNDTIPLNSDLPGVKEHLCNKNISFSEIFRESKHESILDTMMGNIDTQHPPLNPEHPRLQNDELRQELIDARDSGYTLLATPEGKFVSKVVFAIPDDAITGDTFQIKCVVCTGGARFSPHQILIENVDYSIVKESRIDLARPTVKLSIDAVTRFNTAALHISVVPGVEGANAIGPSIDWIDKFKIKRRKVANQGEKQEQYVEIGMANVAQRAPRDNGISAITYIDETLPVDGRIYEYRVTPVNSLNELGTRFADVLTPIREVPNLPGQNIGRRSPLTTNTTIQASVIAEQRVSIEVGNIDRNTASIYIMRRDITGGVLGSYNVIHTLRSNIGQPQTAANYVDAGVLRSRAYEYTIRIEDVRGNTALSRNSDTVSLGTPNSEVSYETGVSGVSSDSSGNTSFDITTEIAENDSTSNAITLIRESVNANNLDDVYEDFLKGDEFKKNASKVTMHKVTRWNLTKGQAEGEMFVSNNKFDEIKIGKPREYAEDQYTFKVETAIVDINNMVDGIEGTDAFKVINDKQSTINGTISSTTDDRGVGNEIDKVLDNSIMPGTTTVAVEDEPDNISLNNLRLRRSHGNNRVRISWEITGNIKNIDFFHIQRQISNLQRESLGTTERNTFFDILDRPDLFGCTIVYYVRVVLLDGSISTTENISIDVPNENRDDVRAASNKQTRKAASNNRRRAKNRNGNAGLPRAK